MRVSCSELSQIPVWACGFTPGSEIKLLCLQGLAQNEDIPWGSWVHLGPRQWIPSLESCCCCSPGLWAAGMPGCATRRNSELGELVTWAGFAGSQIPVLKQYCPHWGEGTSWHCCKKHLNLGPLQVSVWPSETFVLSWFVMRCVWLCTQVCRKCRNIGIKRAKSTQLCTMTLLLNQSPGGCFGFIPCRKLWECPSGHWWGVGWMFCCGWCLTQECWEQG